MGTRQKTIFIYSCLLALLAGALLPLAFAPYRLWVLAFLSPAVLLGLWMSSTPRQAALLGFCWGLGFFGVGVSWVFVSIHYYGQTPVSLAVLITLLFVIVLASLFALQGFFLKKLFKGNKSALIWLGFPSSWVLFEWTRSWIFSGFPWLYLGTTTIDFGFRSYLPVVGVYGASLAILLSSSALYVLCTKRKAYPIMILSALSVIAYGLETLPWVTPQSTYSVQLVQGNVEPFDKFAQSDPIGFTESIYATLTDWKSDIILWPEGAIPLPLPYSQAFINQLKHQALKHHATLITGIQTNTDSKIYNSLIVLGEGQGHYHKIHLVPFGDFLPFDNWLRGLIGFFDLPMSSFDAGDNEQPLLSHHALKLAPTLCYEIAFPEQTRQSLKEADVIVTLSEDGWFGRSWGPHQHLQIAQVRASENGRYVLRATTSGLTAIINEQGQILKQAPPFIRTVLKGEFQAMSGTTPWTQWGSKPLLLLCCLAFVLPGRLRFKHFLKRTRR